MIMIGSDCSKLISLVVIAIFALSESFLYPSLISKIGGSNRAVVSSLSVATTSSSSSSSSSSSTKKNNVMDVEYSDEQLSNALNSLLGDSTNRDYDARHILGYGEKDYQLSKLQKITATRILDYEKILSDPNSPSEEALIGQWKEFAAKYGPIVNLQSVIKDQSPTMALAAEFKRASPSKGDIAVHLNAGEQAKLYTQAGANIISVLTENRWFKGSMEDLQQVRIETNTNDNNDNQRPAILRKEFVTNKYQIAEAAAYGADTILLIVAVLPQNVLKELIDYSRSVFDMEPLVEVHTMAELDVALECGAKVIGVNNRNLHTFQLDLQTTNNIAAVLTERGLVYDHNDPNAQYSICALSGMSSALDVHDYRQTGIGMCLIGESLMRSTDPSKAIQSLCLNPKDYEEATNIGAGGAYTKGTKLIKVCGITNKDDALLACQSGANLIGIIFVPKSKRCVSDLTAAKEIVDSIRQFGERNYREKFNHNPTEGESDNNNALSSLSVSTNELQQKAMKRPLVVGVFQNQDNDYINEVITTCGLDLVQLHGKEGMKACNPKNFNGVPAIRVVDIEVDADTGNTAGEGDVVETLISSLTSDPAAILLDTAIKNSSTGGGTGVTFDWSVAERLQNSGLPVIIAGGLKPDNVQEAVQTIRPWGIDVSSGLEASPGKKDVQKVKDFIRIARETEVEASKGI